MSKTWLILDCNYLCHRAKHSTGGLKYREKPTGVIFGFLMNLPVLQDLFNTSHIAFCWDSKTNKRLEIYPDYKAKRNVKNLTAEEEKYESDFRKQMKKLRRQYLRTIGFKNVFCKQGFEADDVIASICWWSIRDVDGGKGAEAVIVSSDYDLYQLIRPGVSMYNPATGKRMTLQKFKKKYGIHPTRWAQVKAIAGCPGDNVKGVEGVGEKTALKYIIGKLDLGSKAYEKIESKKGKLIRQRNMKLVGLPYVPRNRKEIKIFRLKPDKISEKGWNKVIGALGMKSLRGRVPFGPRRRKK